MRRKIINDSALLEMLKRGIPQKEIAEKLRVSPPAVCQRLKRLIPAPDLDKYGLTPKEKKFVKAKVKGVTNTQAVLTSYEIGSLKSAKVIGTQLMDKPEINMAIKELMDYHGLSRSHRISKLKEHVDSRDPNVSLRGLDLSFKLDGSYQSNNVLNLQLNSLSMIIRNAHEAVEDKQDEQG